MDHQTAAFYERRASDLAPRYESVEGGVSRFFPVLFTNGQSVLDIGAGSGRDCARLLELGMDAWGVEPSTSLRQLAVRWHPELSGRMLDGSLPNKLEAIEGREFDAVVMNAILMHVPEAELFDAAIAVRSILRTGGKLVVSTSTAREDVDPETGRDAAGRLFVLRRADEVQLLFERIGFQLASRWESEDDLGRADIEWATLVFTYHGSSPRPIDRIESIINRDRKTSTYKLALLRALADIAMLRPGLARLGPSGEMSIPIQQIAELWIRYYWPIVESPQAIVQNWNGRGPIRFRNQLQRMIGHYNQLNGLAAFVEHERTGRLPDHARQMRNELFREVKIAIRTGPVTYAGDGEFRHERGQIIVQHDLWRELLLMGNWICDSIILRWAELTSTKAKNALRASQVVDLLLQTGEDPRTDLAVREFYQLQTPLRCAWSDARLVRSFEVDHVIPFALRRDSSLWNLVPAARSVNNAKRDRLPTIDLMRKSRKRIIADWQLLSSWQPDRFRADAAQLTTAAHDKNWETPLYSALVEAVEYTAMLRGVERWAV